MVEKKRGKKQRVARRELTEHRFLPEQTHSSRVSAVLGMVGSLVLGAGVYGQWVVEEPMRFAPILVSVGALGLGAALWLGTSGFFPVRVGDAGIAVERGTQISRVRWCDVERIEMVRENVAVVSGNQTLSIPIGAHPKAVPLILSEADRRVPKTVRVADSERKKLGSVSDKRGEIVVVDDVQVAGHLCASSKTLISFERDARLCPQCGQVYHREHVPSRCVTCEADLTDRVLSV